MWIATMATALSVASAGPEFEAEKDLLAERHQEVVPAAQIWFDRGADPVLERGDRVRVYYRSTVTAFVTILQVDTDGTVRMVYPRSPTENHFARANREYRLLFPRSPYWNVSDRPGLGYFFIVTSPVPFDFTDFRYSSYDGGWDLSAVGSRLYEDPFVAMDDYIERLVPDWEVAPYGLDFVSYSLGAAHQYPRFICYDCHGFKPFNIWDPYRYTCTNFRVVIYDDPYSYPSRHYRGDQVVLVGRTFPTGPRYGFKERGRGERGTPLVVRAPAATREPDRGTIGRLRGRAIPRVGGGAAARSNRPSDTTVGLGAARVRPPVTRQGDVDRRESAPSRVRGARPSTTPEAKRPVLKRRPRENVRPSDKPRPSATPKSSARPSVRRAPAVGQPPSRPRGGTVKRSAPPRSTPAVRKAPARRSGGTPTRTRRPGG